MKQIVFCQSHQLPSVALIFVLLLSRCASTTSSGPQTEPSQAQANADQVNSDKPSTAPGPLFAVPILFTSDEHGWLDAHDRNGHFKGGMANLLAYWHAKLNYQPDKFLTLSGGDCWTGPYTSTVLHGAPMVQVMNAIGYDAQAIGNHDFDFGPEQLLSRSREAQYPLLAANVYRQGSQQRPAFAQSHTIVRVGAARVGVIGLTNVDTPVVTDPRNVAGLSFTAYAAPLRRETAALRAQGVDLVVAIIHDEVENLLPLVPLFRELGISFVGSGHSHRATLSVDVGPDPSSADDVILCNPGAYARGFCQVTLQFQDGRLLKHQQALQKIEGETAQQSIPPNPEIFALVQKAHEQAAESGAELLIDSHNGLPLHEPSQRLGRVVTDAWLEALPQAQIAITNKGGLRQDIDPGPVTMATLVGVLPFDNYLVLIDIDGAALLKALAHPQTIASGVRYSYRCGPDGQRQILQAQDSKGQKIDPKKTYHLVVNEFIYRGGDRYQLREADPSPEETGVHWRDPVARSLREMHKAGQSLDPRDDGRVQVEGQNCSAE